MLVRTFQAGEMSEALRMVKAEMGLDAMILSTKKERRRGILGYFSKPYFEVTAALEPRLPSRSNSYRESPDPVPPVLELSTREEFQNTMIGPLAREVRELKVRIEALSKKDSQERPVPLAQPEITPGNGPRSFAKEELDEIKQLLYNAVSGKEKQLPKPVSFPLVGAQLQHTEEQLRQQLSGLQPAHDSQFSMVPARSALAPEESPLLGILAGELHAEELSPEVVELLMEQMRPAAEDGAEVEELRGLLAEALAGLITCGGSLRMKKSGPRIMAIVGPTGVGKTTTIAKLAAMHALKRNASVAMVTLDTFRVGAIEQLKSYAKIMDLPLEVAATPQELADVLARHAEKDLILIDTAGRSPKDPERLEDLKEQLVCHPGIEIYLCMSATTRASELDDIIATFGVLPISRIMFTKLDECGSFGCLVNTHLKHKLPLSYFTAGQKVPEDIEVATSRKLATLVVKESAR